MGSGRFSADDWKGYATTSSYSTKTRAEVFTSKHIHKDLDPKGVKIRESRDSKENPNSTAIIVSFDETGSMGGIPHKFVTDGLPKLFTEIYDRKPVTDPHIMGIAFGDFECDQAPLQVTQFEADLRICQQLEKFYLEGNGGGNSCESYSAPLYFAAMHTSIDCFEKRGKKGYLFTVGDEMPNLWLKKENIERFLGDSVQADLSFQDILTLASRQWEIFHLVAEEGNHCSYAGSKESVYRAWRELLGQHVIPLTDYTKLSEVIVSTIQVVEGADHAAVVDSWDGSTGLVISKAIKDITKTKSSGGVVTL